MSYLLSIDKRSGSGAGISARLVCYVTADTSWSLGSTKDHQIRPVYTAFLATNDEARALVSAIRSGGYAANVRPANGGWDAHHLEWPRSAGYHWITQQVGDGTVMVEIVLRELFDLDPGPQSSEDATVTMLVATPTRWADGQPGRRSALFAARLDRRTNVPLLADQEFHDHLLREIQKQEWCVQACSTRTARGALFALPEDQTSEVFADLFLVQAARSELETWIEHSTLAWATANRQAVERKPLPVTFSVAARDEVAYAPEPINTSLVETVMVEPEAVEPEPEPLPLPPPVVIPRRRQMTIFSFIDL